jgi:hypothetical protein
MGDQDRFFKRIAIASLVTNILGAAVGVVGAYSVLHPPRLPETPASQAPRSASPSTSPGPGESPIDSGKLEEDSDHDYVPAKQFWGDDPISDVFRILFRRPIFWIPAMLLLLAGSQVLRRLGNSQRQGGASRRGREP